MSSESTALCAFMATGLQEIRSSAEAATGRESCRHVPIVYQIAKMFELRGAQSDFVCHKQKRAGR